MRGVLVEAFVAGRGSALERARAGTSDPSPYSSMARKRRGLPSRQSGSAPSSSSRKRLRSTPPV